MPSISNLKVYSRQLPSHFKIVASLVNQNKWIDSLNRHKRAIKENPVAKSLIYKRHAHSIMLARSFEYYRARGRWPKANDYLYAPGVSLAVMLARVAERLTPQGRVVLTGQIITALENDRGMGPLYTELRAANHLLLRGFDVRFVDLQGEAQFDFLIQKNGIEIEVECKNVGDDSGRKIHERPFYNLLLLLRETIATVDRVNGGRLIEVLVPDRLETNVNKQMLIAASIRECLETRREIVSADFTIRYHQFSPEEMINGKNDSEKFDEAMRNTVREIFGGAMPLSAGMLNARGDCTIISCRSELPDDVVKKIFLNLKEASKRQFTKTRPAILVAEFNGMDSKDMKELARHDATREQTALSRIANALLAKRPHLISTVFTAQESYTVEPGIVGTGGTLYEFRNRNHALWDNAEIAFGAN